MTPERQRWWDSLPAEEKYIRKLIKHLEDDKKRRKAYIGFNPFGNLWRLCVKDDKMTIKLLRKQIAQYPYRKDTHRVHCPNCWMWIVEWYNEPPYCKYCGQKLRWK